MITPEVSKGFGFRRIRLLVRRALHVVPFLHAMAGGLGSAALIWMCLVGHGVEALGAVAAGVFLGGLANLNADVRRILRPRRLRAASAHGGV
ncbi:hypothetical protein QQM39_45520 [Streptomyces sp. DT2A-34]|uniref:hypothetical protein n=1 Tax=Streptomyces sp. DT2A-34 TaxID=3051182 RepID=UPI00265BDCFA|nr:hypothetical protein [Streptomyces sp. DT2A-34]MDO0917789.1 hypothetical protein [Streptomyces sp. DT2A-34]